MNGLDLSVVEPRIRELVAVMNAGTISTIASCEGHWGPLGMCRSPYVFFKADPTIAAAIERRIRGACWSEKAEFNRDWVISGSFDGEFELRFTIETPSPWPPWQMPWQFRRTLDEDFAVLTRLLDATIAEQVAARRLTVESLA